MAVESYSTNAFVSLDVPGVINLSLLTSEVSSSAVTRVLQYINVDAGVVELFFDDELGVEDKTLLDGIVAAHTGSPPGGYDSGEDPPTSQDVLGANFKDAHRNDLVMNSSSFVWVEYLRLTTDGLPAGRYRVGWTYLGRVSNIFTDLTLRIQVDNAVNLIDPAGDGWSNEQAINDGSDQRCPRGGFAFVSLGAGVHTIDLDFRRGGSEYGAPRLYEARIEMWRVA